MSRSNFWAPLQQFGAEQKSAFFIFFSRMLFAFFAIFALTGTGLKGDKVEKFKKGEDKLETFFLGLQT